MSYPILSMYVPARLSIYLSTYLLNGVVRGVPVEHVVELAPTSALLAVVDEVPL